MKPLDCDLIGTARDGRWHLWAHNMSPAVFIYDIEKLERVDDGDVEFPRFTIDIVKDGDKAVLYDIEEDVLYDIEDI